MCVIHHNHCHEVRVCVCVREDGSVNISLPSFQGEDGVPGNGTAGCPGFQVCVDISEVAHFAPLTFFRL